MNYGKEFRKFAAKTVLKWIPKWQENTDPSGRANKNHIKADVDIAKEKYKKHQIA